MAPNDPRAQKLDKLVAELKTDNIARQKLLGAWQRMAEQMENRAEELAKAISKANKSNSRDVSDVIRNIKKYPDIEPLYKQFMKDLDTTENWVQKIVGSNFKAWRKTAEEYKKGRDKDLKSIAGSKDLSAAAANKGLVQKYDDADDAVEHHVKVMLSDKMPKFSKAKLVKLLGQYNLQVAYINADEHEDCFL